MSDQNALPTAERAADERLSAPAVARNLEPIWSVLGPQLPERGLVLEIAAGTGEHGVRFAERTPGLIWQASDPDSRALQSCRAWKTYLEVSNYAVPIRLDVLERPWPVSNADVVININMIHISPWACTEALMAGAADVLTPGGLLYLYGPYKRDGKQTSESNAAFDQSLKSQNPDWGVRDLEAVIDEAANHGLTHTATHQMPANNLSVLLRRA